MGDHQEQWPRRLAGRGELCVIFVWILEVESLVCFSIPEGKKLLFISSPPHAFLRPSAHAACAFLPAAAGLAHRRPHRPVDVSQESGLLCRCTGTTARPRAPQAQCGQRTWPCKHVNHTQREIRAVVEKQGGLACGLHGPRSAVRLNGLHLRFCADPPARTSRRPRGRETGPVLAVQVPSPVLSSGLTRRPKGGSSQPRGRARAEGQGQGQGQGLGG